MALETRPSALLSTLPGSRHSSFHRGPHGAHRVRLAILDAGSSCSPPSKVVPKFARSVRCKLIPGVATIFPSHILHSVVSTPSEHHRFAGRPILAYKGTKYPVLTSHLANAGVANGRRNAL